MTARRHGSHDRAPSPTVTIAHHPRRAAGSTRRTSTPAGPPRTRATCGGKVLRITVKAGDISPSEANNLGGAYTVPAGNLFPVGTARTRPEIYAMGFRNPFRITLDKDDVAYVTDYSPDSQIPQIFRGPPGTGRVEIVRKPANYGWPLCVKADLPYYKWDFNTSTPLPSAAAPETARVRQPRPAGRRTRRGGSRAAARRSSRGSSTGRRSRSPRSGTPTGTTRRRRTARRARRASPSTGPARRPTRSGCARSCSRSCSQAASVRTAPRRTTTTRPIPARRSSRRTTTARSSSGSSRRTPCARSGSTRRTASSRSTKPLNCGAAPASADAAVPVRQPDGHGVRARRQPLPAHLRRRLLRHQPGRRNGAVRVRQGSARPGRPC